MARVYYEVLKDESAGYLEHESSRRRQHTAMTLIFDGGPLARPDGGVDFERIREVVQTRLADLPRLRSKVRRIPGDGHPVWVDDQEFNLEYHLRQSSLPRPGNHAQLCRTAARIAAGRLDRSRPLWDCWILEGLEGGRFALIIKMHKALAVNEGADLLRALLSSEEDRIDVSVRKYRPRPAPSPLELFSREVIQSWGPSRRMMARGVRAIRQPSRVSRRLQSRAANMLRVVGYALRPASESPFDGNLGPHRTYEIDSLSLETVQQVRRSIGGSVHDVVLALVSGALRRFMETRYVSPATVDLRAVTPVLDADGDEAHPWLIELPIWEASPVERVHRIREQTRRIRAAEDVAPAETLFSGSEWNASRLFSIGARALHDIDLGQIAVLQSPGPKQPLYLDGARLEECYGHLPLSDSSGLGVTVLSYAGRLFVSVKADTDIVHDLENLRGALSKELEAMAVVAAEHGPALRAVTG